jgi:hypothetical protein
VIQTDASFEMCFVQAVASTSELTAHAQLAEVFFPAAGSAQPESAEVDATESTKNKQFEPAVCATSAD